VKGKTEYNNDRKRFDEEYHPIIQNGFHYSFKDAVYVWIDTYDCAMAQLNARHKHKGVTISCKMPYTWDAVRVFEEADKVLQKMKRYAKG